MRRIALKRKRDLKKDDLYLLAGCPPCQKFSMQNRIHNRDEKNIGEVKKLLMQFKKINNYYKKVVATVPVDGVIHRNSIVHGDYESDLIEVKDSRQ